MAKRPKKREQESNAFLDALQFISVIMKSEGTPNETHVLLHNRNVVGFNGILAAGSPIDTDIHVYGNAELLVKAIAKCNEQYSITQLDQLKLSVKSNKFKAIIPCLNPELMTPTYPDKPVASLDNRFREALSAVSVLANEGGQSVITASVLMSSASLIATDRKVILEYYFGSDLPTGIALPKSFAIALSKITKNISKFGFSKNSVTIWFDDESWLKTQTFLEPWPDINRILNINANLWPLPKEFYQGLDAIAPFSETGDVYFTKELMCSHATVEKGATYEMQGLPNGLSFAIKQLNIIRPFVTKIDFDANNNGNKICIWHGEMSRGAIAGKT